MRIHLFESRGKLLDSIGNSSIRFKKSHRFEKNYSIRRKVLDSKNIDLTKKNSTQFIQSFSSSFLMYPFSTVWWRSHQARWSKSRSASGHGQKCWRVCTLSCREINRMNFLRQYVYFKLQKYNNASTIRIRLTHVLDDGACNIVSV